MNDSFSNRPDYADNSRPPLLALVPKNVNIVLDIGCNEGGFGAALKKSHAMEVWGVEPDAKSAAQAKNKLDHVIVDFFQENNRYCITMVYLRQIF